MIIVTPDDTVNVTLSDVALYTLDINAEFILQDVVELDFEITISAPFTLVIPLVNPDGYAHDTSKYLPIVV